MPCRNNRESVCSNKSLNKNHIITEDDFDLVEKEMSSLIDPNILQTKPS